MEKGDDAMHTTWPIEGWEYEVLPEVERERLGDLGREGWELTGVGGDEGARLLYLKRPRQSFRERVTLEQRVAYLSSRGDAGKGHGA
jgi:hypothetical protein